MENNVIVLMIRASTQLPMYGQQYMLCLTIRTMRACTCSIRKSQHSVCLYAFNARALCCSLNLLQRRARTTNFPLSLAHKPPLAAAKLCLHIFCGTQQGCILARPRKYINKHARADKTAAQSLRVAHKLFCVFITFCSKSASEKRDIYADDARGADAYFHGKRKTGCANQGMQDARFQSPQGR
jgi:hypothetical protein